MNAFPINNPINERDLERIGRMKFGVDSIAFKIIDLADVIGCRLNF
jgi:hypothetical protein